MYPRYKKALITALTAQGLSTEAADSQADQILLTLQGGPTMNAPKTKAAAAAAAQCCSPVQVNICSQYTSFSRKRKSKTQTSPANIDSPVLTHS
jgi:hypothetical protein